MTTTVAGGPTPIVDRSCAVEVARHPRYALIAWNTGRGWTKWHLEDETALISSDSAAHPHRTHTRCGRRIPDTRLSHRVGRTIMSDDVCAACIEEAA